MHAQLRFQILRLQATQNKCLRFCFQLDKMSRICVNEFLELNWFNVHDRYLQFIVSDISKFSNQCPDQFNDVFCPVDDNGVAMRCCNKKLKLPFVSQHQECKVYQTQGLVLATNSPITLRPLPAYIPLSTTLRNTSLRN